MRTFFKILAVVLFALSILSAMLWLGGVAGAVTGAGKVPKEIDVLPTVAKVLFVLSLISVVVVISWPKETPSVERKN
ncbi:hypothetical protein [Pseudomonas sp. S1Bt23]|jgi:uncharacterized membrane protein YtjA (UPF0391 family)|uniref:hypothetical protein n=1 Tax=Pseudomonas sp. S1Bt23 TaxID=3095074 RepID=UPI002A5AB017|nr:hypothetical protein [Pseudomonas sp. S1Bt23]WPO47672.1 hypothetical protein SHB59_00740 [Pseudomonas sp. S1Bt23]